MRSYGCSRDRGYAFCTTACSALGGPRVKPIDQPPPRRVIESGMPRCYECGSVEYTRLSKSVRTLQRRRGPCL